MALAVGGTGIITGWLLDRLEARLVMGVGAVLVGASLIAASRATTFSVLLAANVAIGIGLGASAWLPSTVVIINWFGDRRGAALGLATAGIESGGMMLTFVAGYQCSYLDSGFAAAHNGGADSASGEHRFDGCRIVYRAARL
jgi:MFS family permease